MMLAVASVGVKSALSVVSSICCMVPSSLRESGTKIPAFSICYHCSIRATAKVSQAGARQIDVFWSTDGSTYTQQVSATNLANLTGRAGIGTHQFLSHT